jgi:hypothetical protein
VADGYDRCGATGQQPVAHCGETDEATLRVAARVSGLDVMRRSLAPGGAAPVEEQRVRSRDSGSPEEEEDEQAGAL